MDNQNALLYFTIMSLLIAIFFIAIIVVVVSQNKKIAELKAVLLKSVPEIMELLKIINNK